MNIFFINNNFAKRYEKKHQYPKMLGRTMKNFINPAKTIFQHHQLKNSIKNQDESFDYFSNDNIPFNPLVNVLPSESEKLPSSMHPFSLSKNILKKVLNRNGYWIKILNFHLVRNEIYCEGIVLKKNNNFKW